MIYVICALWVLMFGAVVVAMYWADKAGRLRARRDELLEQQSRLREMVNERFAALSSLPGGFEPPSEVEARRLDALDALDEATSLRTAGELIDRTLKEDL